MPRVRWHQQNVRVRVVIWLVALALVVGLAVGMALNRDELNRAQAVIVELRQRIKGSSS